MSTIPCSTESLAVSPARASIALVTAIGARVRNAVAHAVAVVIDARMQKALIEAELYRHHYRHSSKNDDDLPTWR